MRSNLFFTIILTFVFISSLSAQEDIQIGSLKTNQIYQSGFFDFSDPSGINIKVQLWGYVRFPGYYIVPARSSVNDLISLAGGPTRRRTDGRYKSISHKSGFIFHYVQI